MGFLPMDQIMGNLEAQGGPVFRKCPVCGLGDLQPTGYPTGLANSASQPYYPLECNRCGFWAVFNEDRAREYREKKKSMEQPEF